jgi:hypothetical protein
MKKQMINSRICAHECPRIVSTQLALPNFPDGQLMFKIVLPNSFNIPYFKIAIANKAGLFSLKNMVSQSTDFIFQLLDICGCKMLEGINWNLIGTSQTKLCVKPWAGGERSKMCAPWCKPKGLVWRCSDPFVVMQPM